MVCMDNKPRKINSSEKDSTKDIEVNRILDKIISKKKLSQVEQEFLDKFDAIIESDLKTLSHLSSSQVAERILYLLNKNKTIICDLYDRNGKINDEIKDICIDFINTDFSIKLKHGDVVKLSDKFLYVLDYNIKKNTYSLSAVDEYFEKITINNED